jgi:hypothetical protein
MLQGTVAFEPEFVGNLTLLTRAMIARGLDPDRFVIIKDIASAPTLPFVEPACYDYSVFTGEAHYAVTESGDARFLDYFLRRIVENDDDDAPSVALQDGVFSRLSRWMSPQL